MIRVRRALLSAFQKEGLEELASALTEAGAEILSSGGTAEWLRMRGFAVISLEDWAGLASMFGGRVKTLHPRVHGGILYRRGVPEDEAERIPHGIEPIDMVVVHLYPFEETIARRPDDREGAIEMIDVGGPAMLRAAAKNHRSVVVVSDPRDYARVARALREGAGSIDESMAAELAARAFRATALYDAAIASYLGDGEGGLPDSIVRGGSLLWELRYGENPSQRGAFYGPARGFPGGLEKLQGKEISFNNLQDLEAAISLVRDLGPDPAAAVIKHATPCGAATRPDLADAFRRARDCDLLSAFGGIVALNGVVDAACADEIGGIFLEAVAAPAFDPQARKRLESKKSLILLQGDPGLFFNAEGPRSPYAFRDLGAGILLQDRIPLRLGESGWRTVTRRPPTVEEERVLLFAWKVVRAVRSNGIVLAMEDRAIGIGGGQTSRIDSLWIAMHKARRAGHRLKGAVMASDAFFPFPDCVEEAAKAGVTAVIHPGGSKRDTESIEAADRWGMAMVLNDARCFRHG